MAFGATHIRFALDLKEANGVRDMEKYIAGTLYPDSRYLTGIDRSLTHGREFEKNEFAASDFKKGWQFHLICDKVQHFALRDKVPFLDDHSLNEWPEEKWIDFTAAKIVEDISDFGQIDISRYLPYFEYAENPNGEDVNEIKRYNNIIALLYSHKPEPDSYAEMMLKIGVPENIALKSVERAREFLNVDEIRKKIGEAYVHILKNYQNYIVEA
jgi:hypothetical protein